MESPSGQVQAIPAPKELSEIQAPAGSQAGLEPDPILVDDFEIGSTQGVFSKRKNRLDAFQGTWARRPSYTVITKVKDSRAGRSGKSLRIEYDKKGGWCGWYTLLNGIDVTKQNALTFWIRGESGGERFDIGLADDSMQDLQIDAVYMGSIKSFLPGGVTTQWQEVKIPIASLRSELKMEQMGSLVFWFRYEGAGAVEVDDVAFVFDPEVEKILEANVPKGEKTPNSPRAMWVWKYDPIVDLRARQALFDFCRRTAIDTIYLYMGEESLSEMSTSHQNRTAEFLRASHEMGLEVQALQGNPLWALKAHHHNVFNWVNGFLDYNQGRPPEERLDGVQLDIEPYLTREWETGDREQLKEDFRELMRDLYKEIQSKEGESDFILGLAIPLFYDREPDFELSLLENVDYAALMAYYDTPTDIIEGARSHLRLASQIGKKIVVGVETQDLIRMNQGKRRNTFFEEGWLDMETALSRTAQAYSDWPAYGGVAIHTYYSYRTLQRGRNVPTKERSEKIPAMVATRAPGSVKVDGALTDWKNAVWNTLNQRDQVVYGSGAWVGPADTAFRIAVQWEPDALLLALDVTDDKMVQESRGKELWEGDHVEVWVDADLAGDFNEAVNSADDFQFGFSPGNFSELEPEAHLWVPTLTPELLETIQVASQKTEQGYTMEIRLPTQVLFYGVDKRVGVEPTGSQKASRRIESLRQEVLNSGRLRSGFRIGLMVDGSDTDEKRNPQKCLLSTSPVRQWGDPTTFNILELH